MDQPLKYRVLRRRLARHGVVEDKRRGKGSHRMFVRVIGGRTVKFPVRCHNENDELAAPVVAAARRAFLLTPDHGVEDADFYG